MQELSLIVSKIRELRGPEATRHISEALAEATDGEELVLRQLRGSLQGPADGSETDLFGEFDAKLVESNSIRRQALDELRALQDAASPEGEAAVAEFAGKHDALVRSWNSFHRKYDTWRSTGGGCDRPLAVATLGSLSLDFETLSSRVRDLPRATFLRPLGELLVEAAELEKQALLELRSSWRPFDANIYDTLDRERSTAGRLRRQVDAGLQDLLPRYAISAQDVGE